MTDVATVLPSEIRLGAPPTMPQARSYMFRQQSTLQSYSAGNQIQINIPRLQRSYLRKDSYLRCAVDIIETGSAANPLTTYNKASTLTFDSAGAFGLIQKIEIFDYLGSTVLESISEVPQLMALLLDLGIPDIDHTTNGQSAMQLEAGCTFNEKVGYTSGASAGAGADATWNSASQFRPAQTGRTLRAFATTTTSASNTLPAYSNAYCCEIAIPLPSFLGFLSKKMVPLHNGFTILITLVSKPETCFFNQGADVFPSLTVGTAVTTVTGSNAAPTNVPTVNDKLAYSMTVSEVYMNCQILELGPVAESMILSSTGGQPLVVHTKSFRSYVGSVSSKAQEFILNLNLNVASLTNVLWMMRSTAQIDKINHQSIGNRTRNMLQRWFFQYGSTSLPQNNGIQTMGTSYPSYATTSALKYVVTESKCTEGFNELMKARHTDVQNSRMTQEAFSWDYKWGATLTSDATMGPLLNGLSWHFPCPNCPLAIGKFAGGLNLELANDKPELISGLNTNGMNTSIRGVFHPLFTDFTDNVRVDAYAEYDAFINISPGIASTVSF